MTYLGVNPPRPIRGVGALTLTGLAGDCGRSEVLEDMTLQELEAEIGSGGATTASAGSATTATSR